MMRLPHSNESELQTLLLRNSSGSLGCSRFPGLPKFRSQSSEVCQVSCNSFQLFTEPQNTLEFPRFQCHTTIIVVLQLGLYPLAMHPKASPVPFWNQQKSNKFHEFQWVQWHCLNSAPTQIVLSRCSKTRPVDFLTPAQVHKIGMSYPFLASKSWQNPSQRPL